MKRANRSNKRSLEDPLVPAKDFRSGVTAVLDGNQVMTRLGSCLPPLAADLLEVAYRIYIKDRTVRRGNWGKDYRNWPRSVELEMAVRHPEIWDAANAKSALVRLLKWLTDDRWSIEFRQNEFDDGPLSSDRMFLFSTPPKMPKVALFSGGWTRPRAWFSMSCQVVRRWFWLVFGRIRGWLGRKERSRVSWRA